MIRCVAPLRDPSRRLVATLEGRGLAGAPEEVTWIAGLPDATDSGASPFRDAPSLAGGRLLLLTPLGTHRDSVVPALRHAWQIEEEGRALGMPVLTLRLGAVVGAESPLWRRLQSNPVLPRDGRPLVQPVHEEDVVETLARAIAGSAAWEGWYEVVGREVVSLAELRALAVSAARVRTDGAAPHDPGSWEPALEILAAQRLAEPEPWISHFGIEPRPLSSLAGAAA